MGKVVTIRQDDKPIYKIHLEHDFDGISKILGEPSIQTRKVCVVTDSRVAEHYLDRISNMAKGFSPLVVTFVFLEGEERKNLDTITALYRKLIECKFERNDLIVALGGGVTGDMAGFAAATFLRGIRFVQIPTSLLSMVDSSIGGKTGVDVDGYKNMVGSFHQPFAVYINTAVLSTLPDVHYISGFGEIIKHALIMDASYLDDLERNRERLLKRDGKSLEETIYTSCMIKRMVIERDPYEKKERVLLNYGHTLGHAIEKHMGFQLLHGQCVSLGMVAASYLSWKRGNITEGDYNRIVRLLRNYGLPVRLQGLDVDEVLEIAKNDKKMKDGRIQFILLREIGQAYTDIDVTESEMRESLEWLQRD